MGGGLTPGGSVGLTCPFVGGEVGSGIIAVGGGVGDGLGIAMVGGGVGVGKIGAPPTPPSLDVPS